MLPCWPRVLNLYSRGHEFNNLGRGLQEYHKHAISLFRLLWKCRKYFLSLNTFSLFGHNGAALGPEPNQETMNLTV